MFGCPELYVREVLKPWRSPDDMEVDDMPEKVVLQRSKNQYVGISAVYDCIYRPKVHSDKTLYKWIQMATRVKKPTKSQKHVVSDGEDELDLIDCSAKQGTCYLMPNISANTENALSDIESDADELNIKDGDSDVEESDSEYSDSVGDDTDDDTDDEGQEDQPDSVEDQLFLEAHPLHDTHMILFKPRKKHVVPNFIGGSLPRHDHGDREYYCATMLTLFKPWRTGMDLKSENYLWDETFMDHKFTQHQQQLMDNFNIRYECNDARDDFCSQLKKGNATDGFPQWMSSDVMDEIDQEGHQGDDFGDEESPDDEDFGVNKYSTPGQLTRKVIKVMILEMKKAPMMRTLVSTNIPLLDNMEEAHKHRWLQLITVSEVLDGWMRAQMALSKSTLFLSVHKSNKMVTNGRQ
jgi:hypothetical protein